MPIKDVLEQIAIGWSAYRDNKVVDSSHPIHALVTKTFRENIRAHLKEFSQLKFEGSTGAGNITAAPWMAVFDPRVTQSATKGYYVVYLFSLDLKAVTLCIAFGTTQFEKQFGGPTKAFPRMREAASRLQDLFRQLVPETLSRKPIQLGATPNEKLHYAYEQSAIFSYAPYKLDALPSEEQLVADLRQIVQIYTKIVSDPLTPELDLVVQTAIVPAKVLLNIEVKEFKKRSPSKQVSAKSQKGNGTRRRYSSESRKVGVRNLLLWDAWT
ncbi:MAG TPA: DUF3578 domain-containing protein [Candidatus Udaeobacter sp.]|nr:DUF3578 domain-containing protein [Candidatus Udaeobacter sp.]